MDNAQVVDHTLTDIVWNIRTYQVWTGVYQWVSIVTRNGVEEHRTLPFYHANQSMKVAVAWLVKHAN